MKAVFDKETSKTYYLKNDGFENDLDGGLAFWPKYVYHDSILIDYVNANKFLTNIKNGNSEMLEKTFGDNYSKLVKTASEVDEMSNPIIIILKHR